MARQKKTEYVEIVKDEAYIHQRETVWYARIRVPGMGTYFRASAGTKNREEAIEWCRAKHQEIAAAPREALGLPDRNLGYYLDRVLERTRRDALVRQASASKLQLVTSKVGVLKEYWRDSPPSAVTEDTWWDNYITEHRLSKGRTRAKNGGLLSRVTLRHERWVMTMALKLARSDGKVLFVPDMRLPIEDKRVRPSFREEELDQFEEFVRNLISQDKRRHVREARERLLLYIMLLRYTGLRTNDTLVLRWYDITIDSLDDKNKSEILVINATGKGKDRLTISKREAVPVYRALLAHTQEAGRYTPTGLVFPNENNGPKSFEYLLRTTLEAAGLRRARNGRVRSAYSLRHAYAMAWINRPGARRDHLALNMGCSERVIEEHYGSHMDPLLLKNELAG